MFCGQNSKKQLALNVEEAEGKFAGGQISGTGQLVNMHTWTVE